MTSRQTRFRKRKPVKPRDHPAHGARICTLPIRAINGEEFAADIWLDLNKILPVLQRALYGKPSDPPGTFGTGHAELGAGAIVIHLRGVHGSHGPAPVEWTVGEPEIHDWGRGDTF